MLSNGSEKQFTGIGGDALVNAIVAQKRASLQCLPDDALARGFSALAFSSAQALASLLRLWLLLGLWLLLVVALALVLLG